MTAEHNSELQRASARENGAMQGKTPPPGGLKGVHLTVSDPQGKGLKRAISRVAKTDSRGPRAITFLAAYGVLCVEVGLPPPLRVVC